MNDLFKKRNELAQKLASMTTDDVLKMRTGYAGKSQQWQYGFDLACREKQIEIDALKAQNAELISSFSEVLRISDRQHDAWDAAKASIAKARGDL